MTVTETMTERTPTWAPERSPSRDDPGTTRCPVCRRCYTPVGRQLQHRLPQDRVPPPTPATRPGGQPSRPPDAGEITVYECPATAKAKHGLAFAQLPAVPRRARYGAAPPASRVADAIAARRPPAALGPRSLYDP